MRFESFRAKGLGPFNEEVSVDLAGIDAKLIAVCGPNGAGKSTTLELLAGALYRQCPTRGSLCDLATSRDAFVEVEVVNGQRYRIRQTVDAVSKKGETVIVDAENRPVVASGKVRDADNYIAKHLVAPEVLFASMFSVQGSGGFLDLKAGERKGVLLRSLGIERLEALAEKAREHARTTKAEVTTLDARINDEKARASDPDKVAEEIATLHARRSDLELSLGRAREQLAELVAQEDAAKESARAAAEATRRREELNQRLMNAQTKHADLIKRLGNNQGLLDQAREIRDAQARAAELDVKIAKLTEAVATARTAEAFAIRERDTARNSLADVSARSQRAADKTRRLEARLADRAAVDAASAALPDLRAAVASTEAEIEALERSVQQSNDLALNGASIRIDGLRSSLTTISTGGTDEPVHVATTALVEDDTAAARAEVAPKRLAVDRKALESSRARLASKRRELTATEATAARSAEIAAAESELAETKSEVAKLAEESEKTRVSFDAADEKARMAAETYTCVLADKEATETERAKIDPLIKLADRLTSAEARIAELSPQVEVIATEIAELEAEQATLPAPSEPMRVPDILGQRKLVDSIDRELRSNEAALAVREAQLVAAKDAATRLAELEEQRRRQDEELADWTRLADDLGKGGVQALEVDAAGPALTTIANTLLHEAFGPRFTIRFDTTRKSSDGKKEIEGLDVSVIDTERGRDANAETLSGGERVIISEAIALALSTIACQRSGVEHPTLIRDESGAALDEGRAGAYVRMLRRAADLIGADKVLLVSHSSSVWDLCDARIEIADGKVSVAA